MFRPPTDGYVEQPIQDSVRELLLPRPTCKPILAPHSFDQAHIDTGDLIVVEPMSRLVDGAVVLIKRDSEILLARLYRVKGKWYAKNDELSGVLSEQTEILGRVSYLVKDQLR